ncbi:MAG: N-acetylmuramoyl-L-alanine amidase [Bacteroidales bacterium]|nr:N-acetylmuramoyl-L-alanine amidase [Bacteroidales bacterium]
MGAHKNAANLEVCKMENSVILLEDDYSTKYQGYNPDDSESFIFFNLMQNAYMEQSLIFADLCQKEFATGPIKANRGIKQGGLLVLWRTTMPSVLVELGFMTNASDKSVLATSAGRKQLAENIFAALEKFKLQYEQGSDQEDEPAVVPAEPASPQNVAAGQETARNAASRETVPAEIDRTKPEAQEGDFYAIQIFAVSKNLPDGSPEFRKESDVRRFRVGNVYKYTVGTFGSESAAKARLAELRKKFPGCFVVKINNFEIEKK